MRSLFLSAAVCVFVCSPCAVRAEVHGGGDVEMGFGHYDEVTVLTPQISGWVGINQRARVEASFGFVHIDLDGEKHLEPGNPFLGAAFTLPTRARSYAGIGLAFPVASFADESAGFGDALLSAAALSSAWNMRSLRDLWLWFPDTFTVVVSGGAATAATDSGFEASITGDAAVLIATKTQGRDKAELDVQLVGAATYSFSPAFRVGAELAAVWLPTGGDSSDDDFQLSVEPFVGAAFGPVSARVGLNLPIDEPLGPPFSDDAGWGLRFGLGFAL
jgi:hypothetical protein